MGHTKQYHQWCPSLQSLNKFSKIIREQDSNWSVITGWLEAAVGVLAIVLKIHFLTLGCSQLHNKAIIVVIKICR